MEVIRLIRTHRKPGQNDLLALALALQERCPLLTGDARLREAALQEKVETRGTLWLIECIYDNALLDLKQVKAAYQKLHDEDRRLPWDLVEQQLRKLESA